MIAAPRFPVPAGWRACALTLLVLAAASPASGAGLADVNGHISVGYAKLFVSPSSPERSPGGSLSLAGGFDVPVGGDVSVGPTVGFHLLGSRTTTRGSLFANIDYSAFEVDLQAHWAPAGLGPVGRVSFGPALVSARAELSTAGGGAAFSDLAVEEVGGGWALDVTLMQHRRAPVRVGVELGWRAAYLSGETWSLATARATFHY